MKLIAYWMNSTKEFEASTEEEFLDIAVDNLGYLWLDVDYDLLRSVWQSLVLDGYAYYDGVEFYEKA